MAERCGGGRCILDRIRWKKKIHGNKFPVKFCLPAVVSRPAGKHALRKLNLRRRRPPRSIDRSRHRNRSNRRRKIIFAERSKINGASAENCSGPENRDESISLCKHIANAIEISIVFEHLDRSTHRNRSNRRRKIAGSKYGEIRHVLTHIVSIGLGQQQRPGAAAQPGLGKTRWSSIFIANHGFSCKIHGNSMKNHRFP